jgi:hypothetical protein
MGCVVAAFAFVWVSFFNDPCQAQRKYKDPLHPAVIEVADNCAEYLEASVPGAGSIGFQTIGALALIEYHKRYSGTVPFDDPVIKPVVEELAALARAKSEQVVDGKEMYFPCLALITLAEYDSKKYKKEVQIILDGMLSRQLENGGFTYKGQQVPDTSQGQFAALAFYIAYQHRIPLKPEYPKKLLDFYVQYQAGNGSWNYRPQKGQASSNATNSIHSASLSSVYLLADMLNLSRRVKKVALSNTLEEGFPKNVSIYIPPADKGKKEMAALWARGEDPIVDFDKTALANCKSRGNAWYQANFRMPSQPWSAYFMYAFERYAYFKEQADGRMGGATVSWYDNGVDALIASQGENGSFTAQERTMGPVAATALSLLFLVRASEVISLPPATTELLGGEGFGKGEIRQDKRGRIISNDAEKSLGELMGALADDNLDDRQLEQLNDAMKRAIQEFKSSGNKSRGEIKAFLQSMISEKNFNRRMIAIKFLASEQDMDNVPALLYAMGDPDERVCLEAHNGLRLISRKFDTFRYVPKGNREDNLAEFIRLKRLWTEWFLAIRPDAELLE